MFRPTLFLSPDAEPVAQPKPAIPPERKVDDFTARMISQHGSVENALRAIAQQKFTADDTVASLTGQLDQLKARLPDGAVVLPKAEAENYAKVIALKLTPDEIVARVGKAAELETSVARAELEKIARSGAPQFGLDPDGLADYVVSKGMSAEMRDATVTEGGKSVTKKVLHVRSATKPNDTWKPAGEYVGALQPFEQRALKASGTPNLLAAGVPHPAQVVDVVPGEPVDRVGAELKKMNDRAASRPNALFPNRKPAAAT